MLPFEYCNCFFHELYKNVLWDEKLVILYASFISWAVQPL